MNDRAPTASGGHGLSVVIPLFNEAAGLPSLHQRNGQPVSKIERDLELIRREQYEKAHPSGTPEEEAEDEITDSERKSAEA